MNKFLSIVSLVAVAFAAPVMAKEYIVTAAKPNKLFVVDTEAREVVKDYTIAGPGSGPNTIEVTRDGIAYVVSNNYKDIVGIDLATGEEVFRASMSQRTINLGLAISPDGSRIYSYEIPAHVYPDHYEALPTRISVYPADGGLDAVPTEVWNDVPRRIHLLMISPDGEKLYALGWDLYTLDAKTGKILETFPLRNWKRENATQPDLLNFWPMPEASGLFSVLVTYVRTDVPEGDVEAFKTALLTLDLETGKAAIDDVEVNPTVYFTTTVGPDRRYAYAGFLELAKIDLETYKTVQVAPLDHSYYQVNVSLDGDEVFVGGTMCDIGIYATGDLKKLGQVVLPDCPNMATSALRVVDLDLGE